MAEQEVFITMAGLRKLQEDLTYLKTVRRKEAAASLRNAIFAGGTWENPDYEVLKEHLYRVQKLSSKFYEFRLNTEASIQKNSQPYYVRIQSFGEGKTGWNTFNPLKVIVSVSGKIQKL